MICGSMPMNIEFYLKELNFTEGNRNQVEYVLSICRKIKKKVLTQIIFRINFIVQSNFI